ncbi:hypothetical protein J4411_02285 [Candidatus Pacearchaeota archaeon]|nr:hypothetical protein [Candidatus Pacearchaeota archaeon]
MGTLKVMIELREVFLALALLLLIISYFKDNFDFFGITFIAGGLVIILSIALYLINFFNKLP